MHEPPNGTPDPGAAPEEPLPPSHVGDPEAWRPVIMGQLSEPLVPPHPEPPETPEDELTRAALEDPAAQLHDARPPLPGTWRLVILVLIAVAALSLVFRLAR